MLLLQMQPLSAEQVQGPFMLVDATGRQCLIVTFEILVDTEVIVYVARKQHCTQPHFVH